MHQRYRLGRCVLLAFLAATLSAQSLTVWKDPSPHIARFVTVDKGVRLEVLDWGGSGRPIVLLAGGGDTAHVFDDFAPKLSTHYHVFGITRRGFGTSGYSAADIPAKRLRDDVLAVLDALNLKRPILVGHSIAGAELSAAANSQPDRIGGIAYLDAAYSYAFDNGKGANAMDAQKLHGPEPPPPSGADLASFGALQKYYERVRGFRIPEAELRAEWTSTPDGRVGTQLDPPGYALFMPLFTSAEKYTAIPVPALVIFANPHSQGAWVDNNTDPAVQAAAKAYSNALTALTERQAKAVRDGLPTARVITVPNANHYVYLSNEAEVLSDLDAFIDGLR
jgi:non-heme chloroperoxidase